MSLPVAITISYPDPTAAPTTFVELVDVLRQCIEAEVTGDYAPYVLSNALPGVLQEGEVWHKIDPYGRPLGSFVYYSGAWRQQPTGRKNQICLYTGDPAIDFAGTNGLGTVEGEWDGWALCNGLNGTENLSNKFVVGAKIDDLAVGHPGAGPWKTSVDGTSQQTGGIIDITSDATNTFQPVVAIAKAGKWTADGNTPNSGGGLYGNPTGGGSDVTIVAASAGVPTPPAIPILPPYYALAYVQYVGYAAYV